MIGIQKIDDRLEYVPECGCWIWTGTVNSRGYGTVRMGCRTQYVHRVVWRRHNKKPIPKGMVLLHKCDTRRCCNPLHTKPGSHKANMKDMVRKGRAASRSNGRHAVCKLGYRIAMGYNMEMSL
jgi:hypothetical protein